ncbi:hypothetical protein QVH35_11185 [Candidatus Nitrosotenuis chungbukensis]|uniref:hypothetical protein n=1 Tax=Candidatus Nitrosotenuis chungbukensis TaxID=1353246 RepID=UPI0012FED9D9|nr:hypothetical protein [Candidatus Nitrosotenuis chungbukensis]WKT57842.1 hypothetical protein QVH35_11185 [Candidatus Nitrosotenuis chungbukensis]
MKLLIFTVLALFVVFGAGSASAQSSDASDSNLSSKYTYDVISEFVLKLNQDVVVTDDIMMRFSNVTSDSRCPSDVTCIWQGEIRIQVDVKKENTAFESIVLGTDDVIPVFGKYFIRLLKVEPYPQSTHQIQQDEYVATLAITKINKILSPLQQFKSGVSIDKIQCKESLQLVIRASDDSPACVTPATKAKLIERGWAY